MTTTNYIFNKQKMYEDFKDDPLYTKEGYLFKDARVK